MSVLHLGIDPASAERARATFAREGVAVIDDALEPASAAALLRHLEQDLAWSRTLNLGQGVRQLEPDQLAALDPRHLEALAAMAAKVPKKMRYLYDTVRISDHPADRADRGWLVDRFCDLLNAPDTLALLRDITGARAIAEATAHATRYLPGHFITEHDDSATEDEGHQRLVAFVLHLSSRWDPQWGGVLEFPDPAGGAPRALQPAYNRLHLFAVPRDHRVTPVAPNAPAPRLALTGWFRD
jgi:SM-20-related protein